MFTSISAKYYYKVVAEMKFEVQVMTLNEVTLRYSRQYPLVIAMQHLCDIRDRESVNLECKVLISLIGERKREREKERRRMAQVWL